MAANEFFSVPTFIYKFAPESPVVTGVRDGFGGWIYRYNYYKRSKTHIVSPGDLPSLGVGVDAAGEVDIVPLLQPDM